VVACIAYLARTGKDHPSVAADPRREYAVQQG
jgi:hypothetical protein